jgi:cytochrome c oxidase cbb3-type subunit III
MRQRHLLLLTFCFVGVASIRALGVQGPPAAAPAQGGRAGGAAPTYPAQQRQLADAAVLARGKTIYSINCTACHGVDARGGDQGGPNLLRSALVLNDQHGELFLPIVRGERAVRGMPPLTLEPADVTAVAEFIHSLAATRARGGTMPLNVLVGNAAAGQAEFASRCASCHSVTGDLKGIGAKNSDPMALQNFWIAGGSAGGRGGGPTGGSTKPVTVTVTFANGQKVDGRLARIDDFVVSLVDADNATRTFVRDGDRPKVEVHNPLDGHLQLLSKYTDDEIHNITAYLVTLK